MFTVKPFVSRARRKLGFASHYRNAAVKRWMIEPPSETVCRPAFFDEEDLKKITGVPRYTTVAYQKERLLRKVTPHRPIYANVLRDVVMVRGHLFKWNVVQPLADSALPSVAPSPRRAIDCGALASTEYGNRFFGHWLCDDIPLAILASDHGRIYGHIGRDNVPSPHQAEYSDVFGIDIDLVEDAVFRELTIFEGVPENSFKAKRYAQVRRALRAGGPARDNPGVMLLRKASGQRRILVNEAEVGASLERRGFTVIDPMQCSVAEIVDACRDARILLGVEGSHLAHGFVSMHPSGTLFTLQPPFKFDLFWRDRCNCIGATYGLLVGDPVDDGFKVDIDVLNRALDRVERATALRDEG